MNVWAISDLHLSFGRPERRDHYAARWRDHADKIARGWREVVRPADVVLLPGDLSMARNHRELQPDLEWLGRSPAPRSSRPGITIAGGMTTEAVRRLLRRSMVAVGGDAAEVRGLVVCGTRGAPAPTGETTEADRLAADRELESLDRALDQAAQLRGDGDRPLYVLWHFPPFDANGRPGPWVERFERAGVTACVYGHLHIQGQWSLAVQGDGPGRPVSLRRRRRHRLPALADRRTPRRLGGIGEHFPRRDD